jgi:uncharacterized protein (DUF362 family)
MNQPVVAIVRYERPLESVGRAVQLSGGLDRLPADVKVFIKPNIVFWTKAVPFPKWGVITTSRVVEDMVVLLKERGIDHITIGEGTVTMDPKDRETPAHAFESLGYNTLKRRYGIKVINVFERPFEKVEIEEGLELNFNRDILQSGLVVDLPVLKTHNQTVVSLGIKNLKGVLDIPSRKKCHSADPGKDLNYLVAKLADRLPPVFTLLDGIYTNERGPSFDGRIRRSNLLIASWDVLAADMVGARVLGHDPSLVPHLVHAAGKRGRPLDLSDVKIVGEDLERVAARHEHDFAYVEDERGSLPLPLSKQGIRGLSYRKYDLSMCTYCSGLNGLILTAIRHAWEGSPWEGVEVLTGKSMKPTPGKKKTILMGKCIYQAHKDHPDIQEMIPVKGCPPQTDAIVKALHRAGIQVNPALFQEKEKLPGFFMQKYRGLKDFEEALFRVEE